MATSPAKAQCITCVKEKSTVRCDGCLQSFCINHFNDHRQQLNLQFEEIQVTRDLFRQTLTEHSNKPQNHKLFQEINQWEQDSIRTIKQTAEETRQILQKYTNESFAKIEIKLNKLTKQLEESQK